MIPYDAKTATEHRQRWQAAVAHEWDFSDVPAGEIPEGRDRPGIHPENVFDFHDGLRLIVSTDKYAFGTYLHVSASARPERDREQLADDLREQGIEPTGENTDLAGNEDRLGWPVLSLDSGYHRWKEAEFCGPWAAKEGPIE